MMIHQEITQTVQYQRLLAELRANARVISISGLVAGSARALAIAALQRDTGKTFAVVTQSTRDLETLERDVRFWYAALSGQDNSDSEVLVLPASETDPYAGISPHAQTLERRALALWQLQQRRPSFVLLTARALARKSVSPDAIAKAGVVLRRDEDYSPEALVEKLMATGYMREDPVGAVGEFSMRGGIVDVWPPGREAPVRLEFFGDTIDSLREFDPENQLSTGQLKVVEVPPMHEYAVTPMDFQIWSEGARERWSDERYARSLRDRTAFADEGEAFAGWEWLIPITMNSTSSLFDHLGDAVLVVDEPAGIESYLSEFYERLTDRFGEIDQADDIALAPEELFLTVQELQQLIPMRQRLELRTLGRAASETDLNLSLEAEAPKVELGRTRGTRQPVFLFP
ncbi:MAG TPA: hypothetical protein VFR12_13915, partial [Pyrinomonadaceae bacterium]|nr:hypothetical protein [Pyrinomonadaceae bacterium]